MTDEAKLHASLAAIAEPEHQLDEHAAWQAIEARIIDDSSSSSRRRRARTGITAVAAAAVAITALVLAVADKGPDDVHVAATGATGPGGSPDSESVPMVGSSPMVIARGRWGGTLELREHAGSAWRVLTTAGAGRWKDMPDGYGLRDVSTGSGAVWFTETEGPEDQPSIWRLDLATLRRELVARDAFAPAVTPNSDRLAYVASRPLDDDIEESIVIRDLRSGDERAFRSYPGSESAGATRLTHLEWSPDGARLMFLDASEQRVGIIDPASGEGLSDATFLPGEHAVATWLDHATILSGAPCCDAGDTSPELVVSDAGSGKVLRRLGVVADRMPLSDLAGGPDGRFLLLTTEGALYEVSPDDTMRLVSRGVGAVDW